MAPRESEDEAAGEQLVVLREVTTRVEADLIVALLKGEGIPCIADPGMEYDVFGASSIFSRGIRIRVRAGDLARAQAAISPLEQQEKQQEEHAAREEDFCPYCGEYLVASLKASPAGAMQSCPRCGRDISEWVALREEPPSPRLQRPGPAPQPVPAHMQEHSTTWRLLFLLVVAAVFVMLFTAWGRQVAGTLLRMIAELARHAAGGMSEP